MFLVNFGIKTKRDEISGFKERAIMEEHKMRKRAQRLHEDAVLFDEFLKATDEAAVEAMKRTEKETKTKIEKTAELRRMQVKLNSAKGDISKTDETLSDYLRYKSFLLQVKDNLEAKDGDLLTSDEWLEKRVKERKLEKERKKRKKKPESQAKQRAQRIAPYINRLDVFIQLKRNTTPRTVTRTSSKLSFSKVDFPEEWDTTSPQSENGKFHSEIELLQIIKDLEEENLKMIYHFQHSEEALEETKVGYCETKAKLVKEVLVLKKQVLRMEKMIADAQERSKELKLMCQILDEGTHENGDQALVDLNEKVEKVYYNVVGKLMLNIDGLMMLTNIENKMELLLDEIESLPEAAVKEIQKIKDKERRLQLREDKLAIQRHRQEDRARKAQERANANSFKRVGRRLVFRSEPIKGRVAKASNDAIVTTDSSLFLAQH
uniref:DUF4200 domain-containing protein n=1 Tax=Ciona savignyi TaxID=51511 RepID=H2YIP6_CIOSA